MNTIQPVTISLGGTDRRDNWWIGPLATALGLGIFVIYATYVGIVNGHYIWGPYLSPFYSPLIEWSGMPKWLSPAFLILIFPAGFRATCYYYRKAYYRAFFFNPPACAVGKGKSQGYTGERAFPFIIQNLHRYFLYFALLFILILGYDAVMGMHYAVDAQNMVVLDPVHNPAAVAGYRWGFGLGTLVMFINVILLTCYTCGCHSLRHLVGGKTDCFSCHVSGGPKPPARFGIWQRVSWLNGRHMQFAWASLTSVGLTDLYIRLLSYGFWPEPILWLSH